MSNKFRISASVVLASATVALLVAHRPDYHRPELVSSGTTSIVFNEAPRSSGPDYSAQGTFATEKLKVTGTGSDSIVAAGGMQMAGSASFGNGSTLYGVTITASTNHAGNALALKAVDNVQDGASVRFLRNDNTIRWSLGNNTAVGSVIHDLYLFDNTNLNYALYLNPATTSYLRMGLSAGRLAYDDTTHTMTMNTNAVTRLTITDSLITSSVALDAGTHLIHNVVNPVDPQDAATKAYVDAATTGAISGSGTANTMAKFTGSSSIGNSQITDDGTTVAVGGTDLTINTSANTFDWRGGFFSLLPNGSVTLGYLGGIPVTNFSIDSVTGNVGMNNGNLNLTAGSVLVGSGQVTLGPTGTGAFSSTLTADGGLRVFDVAGAGLTSSTNTVDVAAAVGGGITVNADSIQMTFCGANQIPQMNAGGTAWGCAAAATGTITGSLTSPGVTYASGASAITTDASNFTYYATEATVNIGATAVTNCGGGACDDALNVTTGIANSLVGYVWSTSTSGYSGLGWNNSSSVAQGSIGFANSAVSLTNYRGLNFFSSGGPDWIFGESTGGSVIARVFMTSGSAGMQFANGSSGGVGAANTGKLRYNSTSQTFQASNNGAAFADVVTSGAAANAILKSASSTTHAATASSITDDGTTVAINTNKFTVTEASGNTLIAGTLDVTGNVAVNTNKFTVNATSGNTLIAGTGSVTGDFAVNSTKFTVNATTGNTAVDGTLKVAGGTISGSGTGPSLSGCNTSPTLATGSSNMAGKITTGASGSSNCVLTFSKTFDSKPFCLVYSQTDGAMINTTLYTITTTSFTFPSAGTSRDLTYICGPGVP